MPRGIWGWILACSLAAAGCGGDDGGGRRDTGPGVDGGPADAGGACVDDMGCDDGLYCNGTETCASGACVAGMAPDCSDGMDCTVDACSEAMRACTHDPPDEDADGHGDAACGGDDCDDDDPMRYPGNAELCDMEGVDEDCVTDTTGVDDDGDSFVASRCCLRTDDGELLCGADCDDTRMGVNPGTPEVCDGVDTNCDGSVDEGVTLTFYRDVDGDGFGTDDSTMTGCTAPTGYAVLGGDCDDTFAAVHPGAVDSCNGRDDDCDAEIDPGCDCTDMATRPCGSPDGRGGFLSEGECVVGTQRCVSGVWAECVGNVGPRDEVCDGTRDEDCDASIDEGVRTTYYRDADADGYGNAAMPMDACTLPSGHVAAPGDCDDANMLVRPGEMERCNGVDDDCDGATDPGCACIDGTTRRCGTTDVGPCAYGTQTCSAGAWGMCVGNVEPAMEICNGIDEDCDAVVDDGVTISGYRDTDNDGWGSGTMIMGCPGGPNFATRTGDCADGNPNVFPGQTMYFTTPRCSTGTPCRVPPSTTWMCCGGFPGPGVISWDFDCVGGGTPEPRTTATGCTSSMGGMFPACRVMGRTYACLGAGFTYTAGTTPACGTDQPYRNCVCPFGGDPAYCMTTTSMQPIGCH